MIATPALADLAAELDVAKTHAGMAAKPADCRHGAHASASCPELPGRPGRRRL